MARDELQLRAGTLVNQLAGDLRYQAFIPKPLPPAPPLRTDMALLQLLSEADQALGRLDIVTERLPNPDLFVAMYVRKEAVLSSQIEGTQSSLVDLLEYEAEQTARRLPPDVGEVLNHVHAMNQGLALLSDIPVSLRLIREMHALLLRGVRGEERNPGEFRTSQNWVGPKGCPLSQAVYVPPPPHEVVSAMSDLERFIHDQTPMPILLKIGLIHAQFETIHPFVDGNGRLGRLLITFLLCERGALQRPLLYLSHYLKRNRQEYYDRLMAIRLRGQWEEWLRFFLQGVLEVSREATDTARRVSALRERHRNLIQDSEAPLAKSLVLLDALYASPVLMVKGVQQILQVTNPYANTLVSRFVDLGLLRQINTGARNRVFAYGDYLDLLSEGT
ncbi:MAG: Fic family protein [candidate division WS1 bacterium]|nr:Fic family protein [candidate division WS1 bacterium]